MIHRIFSDLPKFKNMSFHAGLNVLMADRGPGSTDKQTRNRAGKTSLVEIIHFLLGGSCRPESMFRADPLKEASFGMEFDLASSKTTIQRSGKTPGKLTVIDGETGEWPLSSTYDRRSGERSVSLGDWRTILGQLMFGLPSTDRDGMGKYRPTFRSLIGYFARRQNDGGFVLPIAQGQKQQLWDQQIAVSFLLGFDWTIPREWQGVRERERMIKELRKAMGNDDFSLVIRSSADIRTRLVIAKEKVERLKARLDQFRVLPEYNELEEEASSITRQLSEVSNQNTIDVQWIAAMKESSASEVPPMRDDLERIYKEAGVTVSDVALRQLDEVKRFHESVVSNRRVYLESEISTAEDRIAKRRESMKRLDERRGQIMSILKSAGALEQYTQLQMELSRRESEVELLRQQFEAAEQFEGQKTEMDMERSRLLTRLRQDHAEQSERFNKAILTFEEISGALYENPGSLKIAATPNGPTFDVKIHGSSSKGISNMQIFCFDMMLMRLMAEKGGGPGFLVHDSHLFDGVDDRQAAKALQIGAQISEKHGFQYIVTMNSDVVPKQLPGDFMEKHMLPIRLTDETEDGGLFGVRFG